jgi:hypothetical protein
MRKEPWDWPQEPKKRSRRPRIESIEILAPPNPADQVRVTIKVHRRRNILPQVIVVGALILLALILFRAPSALLMLAVLIPSKVWLVLGLAAVLLIFIGVKERLAGRPF